MTASALNHPSGVYLYLGDEPFALTQSIDDTRAHFKAAGFERELYSINTRFDWGEIASACQTMSLFSQKRLIEGRLDSCKLDKKALSAIETFKAQKDENTVLLLWSLDFDSAILKTKWLTQLKQSISVTLYRPAKGPAFLQWLRQRQSAHQLTLSNEQLSQMLQHFEGNALAAEQCFKQLALLSDGPTPQSVFEQILTLQIRLDIFEMMDAALAGQADKAINNLHLCQSSGMAGLAVLAPLMYQIRQLSTLVESLPQHPNESAACQAAGIWSSKQSLFLGAARRLGPDKSPLLVSACAQAERAFKSSEQNTGWTLLNNLILALSGNTQLLEASLCTSVS